MTDRPRQTGAVLLTVREAAERLRVSERTIHRYISDERLPVFRTPGGGLRFRAEDIAEALTENGSAA